MKLLKNTKSSGQTAVEYLLIFSAVLVVFTTATIVQMINPASDAGRDSLYLSQARTASDAIAGAINTVYSNGQGAVKSISLQIDKTWTLQLDNANNKLRILVEISTGVESVGDNLRYKVENYHALSNIASGTYTVIVEWPESAGVRENLYSGAISDKKIYIYLGRGGG